MTNVPKKQLKMNPYFKMTLYGIVAGFISALVWAGFSYMTGWELGWIAWGVGFLVGLGVRLAGEDVMGWLPGVFAVIIALLAIVCGKYLTVRFVMAREFQDVQKIIDNSHAEFAKVELAKEVVAEYEKQKIQLDWPEKKRLLTSATKGPQMASEFPAVVWTEAMRRWDKMKPDEEERRLSTAKKDLEKKFQSARTRALEEGFIAIFSPFDFLWFLLAAVTAFCGGSRVVFSSD